MICSKCSADKDPESFHISTKNKRGRQYICKPCSAERQRDRHKKFPDRLRNAHLKRLCGISIEDYDRLLIKGRGSCWICGQPEPTNRYLCVDHDHKTGRVRGLLCHNCNVVLGLMNDDPAKLAAASEYLRG